MNFVLDGENGSCQPYTDGEPAETEYAVQPWSSDPAMENELIDGNHKAAERNSVSYIAAGSIKLRKRIVRQRQIQKAVSMS